MPFLRWSLTSCCPIRLTARVGKKIWKRRAASRSTSGDSKPPRVTEPRSEVIVEYEPDPDLRDTEQIPFLEAPAILAACPSEASAKEGIEAFIRREVLPYTHDAWIDDSATKIGYEISFTRHFYKPQPLRTLDEISADILALEKETEGLLGEIVKGGAK